MRLADTRPTSGAYGYTSPSPNVYRVAVAGKGNVPLDSTAVVVNVTAVGFGGPGYVAVYAAGESAPGEANVVAAGAGPIVTNTVHVKIGVDGSIELKRNVAVNLVVDVVGAYAPAPDPVSAGRLVLPPNASIRVTGGTTVHAGSTMSFDLAAYGVPLDATGVLLSLAARQIGRGSWIAYEAGTPRPYITTFNIDTVAQIRGNQTVVGFTGDTPIVSVFSAGGGILVMDIVGWFTGPSAPASTDGLFIPTTHKRQLDTRIGRSIAPFGPATFEFSSGAVHPVMALVGNLWAADGWDSSVVGVSPAGTGTRPATILGSPVPRLHSATHFLARTSTRGVAINTNAGMHLMVDVAGWFLGTPPAATLPVPVNRAFAPTAITHVRWTDAGGTKIREVRTPATASDLNLDRIANMRIGAAYKDRSTLGQRSNVMVFGHRTTYGAMFYYLHTVKVGGMFSLRGADGIGTTTASSTPASPRPRTQRSPDSPGRTRPSRRNWSPARASTARRQACRTASS
jgi:hypothetical protein